MALRDGVNEENITIEQLDQRGGKVVIQYLEPEMEVIYFRETDVITSSGELINKTEEIPEDSNSANKIWGW